MSDIGTNPSVRYDSTPDAKLRGEDASYEATPNESLVFEASTPSASAIGDAEDEARAAETRVDATLADERRTFATYVSDMLALERHLAQPLHRQLRMDDTARYSAAQTVIAQAANYADAHVTALEQALTQLGGHEDAAFKSGWAQFLGWFAAAVDSVRKTKVSKSLRDDYTALNLAAVSYTMLHATAVGLAEPTVADLARTHLADYARTVMEINQIIPSIVLQELQDDGELVSVGAADQIRRDTNEIWRAESDVTQ